MLCKPDARDGDLIAFPFQKIKTNPPGFTPLDRWLARQRGRLDNVGEFARAIKLVGPGQTPLKLRNHLVRVNCGMQILETYHQAIGEFFVAERDLARLLATQPKEPSHDQNRNR
jgi:hypothetical protein